MEIFDYDNILLLPRKCRVKAAPSATPAWSWAGGASLPVVPANMKTVVDEPSAPGWPKRLLLRDAPLRPGQRAVRARHARPGRFASISLGVKQADYATVDAWPPRAGARVHHHRHRPRPRRQRARHDRHIKPAAAAS
jgi:GMP reductase